MMALSPVMHDVLTRLADGEGRIICWRVGHWTLPETLVQVSEEPAILSPVWRVGTETIYALESRGFLSREHGLDRKGRPVPPWTDARLLTDAGRWALDRR